jgi:hypothetical protein
VDASESCTRLTPSGDCQTELYQEREQIDAALAALDRTTGRRRRGRPPKSLVEARAEPAATQPKAASDAKRKKK